MKHKLTILLCVATSFMMQFVFTSCEEDEDEGSESCYSCYGFGGCIFCGTTGKCPICYGVNLAAIAGIRANVPTARVPANAPYAAGTD